MPRSTRRRSRSSLAAPPASDSRRRSAWLEGASVIVTGRRQSELDAAVKTIGRNALGIRGDVANLTELDVLVAAIKERHGRLDILFANAGVGDIQPLGAITEASVDRILSVNIKGTLFTIQKALPLMPTGSAIVINGSMAATKGMPAFSVYAASKAALRSFARGWSVDLKLAGVDPAGHPHDQKPHGIGAHRDAMVARTAIHLGRASSNDNARRHLAFPPADFRHTTRSVNV